MAIVIETVKTDSFTMDYFRFGRGEKTMVILPGLSVQSVMGSAEAVAEAYASMAEVFTVYVFDRRAELPPVYPIREMARDTALAFRALGLKNVYLFGASQGGMIALSLAIEYPELVSRVAVGSTSANVQGQQFRTLEHWVELAKAKDREGLYLDFGQHIYPPAVFDQVRDGLLAASKTATDAELERFVILTEGSLDYDVVDQLNRIRCPVLVLGVYEDSVLDSDSVMEIAEKLDQRPDFRLFMYIGTGHAAFDTAPDYRARLLDFFTRENT